MGHDGVMVGDMGIVMGDTRSSDGGMGVVMGDSGSSDGDTRSSDGGHKE